MMMMMTVCELLSLQMLICHSSRESRVVVQLTPNMIFCYTKTRSLCNAYQEKSLAVISQNVNFESIWTEIRDALGKREKSMQIEKTLWQ
jgi:hypothetical protein